MSKTASEVENRCAATRRQPDMHTTSLVFPVHTPPFFPACRRYSNRKSEKKNKHSQHGFLSR